IRHRFRIAKSSSRGIRAGDPSAPCRNAALARAGDPDGGEDRIRVRKHEPQCPALAKAKAVIRHHVEVLQAALDEWRGVAEPGPTLLPFLETKGSSRFSEGAEHQIASDQTVVVRQPAREAR